MTKRKSLADQVGEQAVTIDGLRNLLSQQKADFAVLEKSYEVSQGHNSDLLAEAHQREAELEGLKLAVGGHLERIIKLEAEVKSKEGQYIYANKRAEAAESEIEQAHATINTIPEAVPAEFEKEYGKGKHSLSARFMGTLVALMRAV